MRVRAPSSLRMSRRQLVQEVRERLTSEDPSLLESLDPGHPGWMLLEQSAWMVEQLSEKLDEYPFAVVRQFAHLLGVQVRPAQPALGVVVVQPASDGILAFGDDPSRWRLFTPQDENHGLVEFSIVDPVAPLRRAEILSVGRIVDGDLSLAEASGQSALVSDYRPSQAFTDEWVTYEVLTSDTAEVMEAMRDAAKLLVGRGVAWLDFDVEQVDNAVTLRAKITPRRAFAGELTDDEGLSAPWGLIDDTTWTPAIRVSDHPMLPPTLRGTRPVPANVKGDLAIRGVPANLPVQNVVERDPRPAPADFPRALWTTLVRLNVRLAPLRPTITRGVEPVKDEPAWVDAAIRRSAWSRLADAPEVTVAHVALETAAPDSVLRVAWVLESRATQRLRAFGVDPALGLHPEPSPVRSVWEAPLPAPDGDGMLRVIAFEVQVPAGADGVVLAVDGRAVGAMVNPLLVVNAPAVSDGRSITVRTAVPEPITLLHQDLVDRRMLTQMGENGLSQSARRFLRELPLARLDLQGADEPVDDWEGVALDPSEGTLTLHAPDALGQARRFPRGSQLDLTWYRRTDGAAGNVGVGEIRLVEQAPRTVPRLQSVHNPLGTYWGADRESDEAAVARVFGPQIQTPITPSDWERLVRSELGTRAARWVVRVWGHGERSLVAHALWPPTSAEEGPRPETAALRRALDHAGPETLLVVLGPEDRVLAGEDLDWARLVVRSLVQRWSDHVPTVRHAIVTPLWTLRLVTEEPTDDVVFPRFGLEGLVGELTDGERRTPVPTASVILNGRVAEAEAP